MPHQLFPIPHSPLTSPQRQRRRQRRSSRHPNSDLELPAAERQRQQHRVQLQLQAARLLQGDPRQGRRQSRRPLGPCHRRRAVPGRPGPPDREEPQGAYPILHVGVAPFPSTLPISPLTRRPQGQGRQRSQHGHLGAQVVQGVRGRAGRLGPVGGRPHDQQWWMGRLHPAQLRRAG